MTSMLIRVALLTGVAIVGLNATPVFAAKAESYVCMTDDGYGRKRPCSAGYKAKHAK